jgi:hypothetical protein
MNLDRKYLIWALSYAAIGMSLGIYMGITKNHGELVAHAHILLVGFVASFIYGIIHKLWLDRPNQVVAKLQFILHHAATMSLFSGLFLLYGNVFPESILGPILGVASVGVLVGVLLMLYMVLSTELGEPNNSLQAQRL